MSSLQELEDGSTRIRFRHEGKHCSRTFPSKKQAKSWQKLLEAHGPVVALRMLNAPTTSNLTVGEHVASHIERLTGVTDGTRKSARAHLSNHMADIATVPLDLFNREAVSVWINRLSSEGLSGKSIRNIHGLLSASMNTAVSDKLIIENPCKGMRLPRTDHKTREMVFLSHEEFAGIYNLMNSDYQLFVKFLVGTGVRFSEATSLSVADLDLKTNSARIRRTWKMTGTSKKELGAPKTKRGNRTIAVPDSLNEELSALVNTKGSGDFLFTTPTGKIIGQQYFGRLWVHAVQDFAGDKVKIAQDHYKRHERIVIKKGKGPHPRVHDLRHTFASWAISAGVPLPVIQRQLGHESITTTIDTYGHLARSDFDALGKTIGGFLPTQIAIESK